MKKIIIIFITLILLMFGYIFLVVYKSHSSYKNLEKKIVNNYKLSDKISYINLYNNYYIIKTTKEIIVLDDKYKKVASELLTNIKNKDDELIYKNNSIMYLKTSKKNKKLIYKYYDIYKYRVINEVEME